MHIIKILNILHHHHGSCHYHGDENFEIQILQKMIRKRDVAWEETYEELKRYILERGHLPNKRNVEHRALLNWAKYNRKKINAGTLDPEKLRLFKELMAMRSNEHTGGRKKHSLDAE